MMTIGGLFESLTLQRGAPMKHRLMFAPMTNKQSRADGVLSDEEIRWLVMRAQGGFSLVITGSCHVQALGQGAEGQLGCFSDQHLSGLSRLAREIRAAGALAALQLNHAGVRALPEFVGQPVGPSDHGETGARALLLSEIEQLKEDYVAAALRAQAAGFDGVEIHGAHGFLLTNFLTPEYNRREDRYGGSLENRSRLLFEIVERVRERTRPDFQVGLRLSPERWGLHLPDIVEVARRALAEARIDYLDMSLWNARKEANDEAFRGRTLASYFTELPRGSVRLGAAGSVILPSDASDLLEAGFDFAILGRSGVLNHDFPNQLQANPDYAPALGPAPVAHLEAEGVTKPFLDYLAAHRNYVEGAKAAAH